MNTLELIKDSCFFGGTVPNERKEEVRTFLDNIEKQLHIHNAIERVWSVDEIISILETHEDAEEHVKWFDKHGR